MNPIYAVLGGLFWKLWGKKFFLWFNHPDGNALARLAIKMSDVVFCTSPFAFASRFKKTRVMPAGIDTEIFRKNSNEEKAKRSILYLGRISPIKRIEYLIEAARILDKKQAEFVLHITGSPMIDDDVEYEGRLKEAACDLAKKGKVKFFPKVRNSETPKIYNQNEIFVNLTPTGSFDKTVLEAMACETLTLVSNRSFQNVIPEMFLFKEGDPYDLANKIEKLFSLSIEEKDRHGKNFRDNVVENQNLDKLIKDITAFSSC
jgi:glycosyltransferase involved in cell wall biosynthesis